MLASVSPADTTCRTRCGGGLAPSGMIRRWPTAMESLSLMPFASAISSANLFILERDAKQVFATLNHVHGKGGIARLLSDNRRGQKNEENEKE